MGKRFVFVVLFAAGCSSSPTSPTPQPMPPPVAVVPVTPVSPPPVVAPSPLLSDPRFDLRFYRMFALGETPSGSFSTLRRQAQAPRIYMRTEDDGGTPIDAGTLDATAAALINTAGSLTGVFGLAGLERGTGTREGQAGWITVRWSDQANGRVCGTGFIGGDVLRLYPKTSGCRCAGGPAVTLTTIKHELGHVLGFYHTDQRADLMHPIVGDTCDKNPSPREVFHAAIAYGQPMGSVNPR